MTDRKTALSLLVLLCANIALVKATTCEELNCSECCGYDASLQDNVCHDDHLICRFNPLSDFSILFTSLMIVVLFAIGMPIFFWIIEVLFLYRSKKVGLSFVECFISYIILCHKCRKRPITQKSKVDSSMKIHTE